MTRWLVAGAAGMLGADVVDVLRAYGEKVTAATRVDLDITDEAGVREVVAGHDVVVNTAAWTDVDGAETAEPQARSVNADGAQVLAEACAATGTKLVHISTDYVFDGSARAAYAEDAPVAPINAYGRTKLAGERAVLEALPSASLVVRTSWLYGRRGGNFVRTIARLADERDLLDVVDDQRGQPTWTRDAARRIIELILTDAEPGIWHATNSGETTWYGLARAVLEEIGADPDRVRAVSSSAFPRPAERPSYSVLGDSRAASAGLEPMRDWRSALEAAAPVLLGHRAA